MTYDNTMKGAIWKNEHREKDTHPHYKGEANINGVDYWVSAWKREDGANPKAPVLKFSFTPKDKMKQVVNEAQSQHQQAKADGYMPPAAPMPDTDFDDDDLPF